MPANSNDFHLILDRLTNNPATLHSLYEFLANSIRTANDISTKGWAVYEMDGGIVFTTRIYYTISIGINFSMDQIEGIQVMAANSLLTEEVKSQMQKLGCSFGGDFKQLEPNTNIFVPCNDYEEFSRALQIIRAAHEQFIRNVIRPGNSIPKPKIYNPAITQYLRDQLHISIPDPEYYQSQPTNSGTVGRARSSASTFETIDCYLKAEGYSFTPTQIASFYTALQTKGFVILSGISGTGKTKMAQKFAEMLPVPMLQVEKQPENVIPITIQKDHLARHRFIIPNEYLGFFDELEPNKRRDVTLAYQEKSEACWMRLYDYPSRTPYLLFWLKGNAIPWFTQNYEVGDTLYLLVGYDGDKIKLSVLPGEQKTIWKQPEKNCLFLSVRPDWRDSKGLLGYFNPLNKCYEWTAFLEHIIKAQKSFDTKDGQAWFVILDEMNLARVEYYFADLLSVLESGRDDQGRTEEPLRLQYDVIEHGPIPPKEIKLPPNLYIIGTVNMDETIQSFSPKVLDRAFCIEFTEVDFSTYSLAGRNNGYKLDDQQRLELQKQFTRDGFYAQIDKDQIVQFLRLGEFQKKLDVLNKLLQTFNHHFGYRVFDEIMMFLKNAEENGMFGDDLQMAFDQAVLMKVLPKFHGSRGKLEKPLHALLRWCAGVDNDDTEPVKSALANPEQAIVEGAWQCPNTAKRALYMIQSLNITGFASFG